MKIINDGLPEPLYKAICNDDYDAGLSDYTPSSLNQPAQQKRLMKGHGDKLEEKASSRIWALQGSSIHYMIERIPEENARYIKEERYYRKLDVDGVTFLIGAKIDLVDLKDKKIYDFKYTSIYTSQHGPKPEWVSQLNVCKWCIDMPDFSLISVPIYRDRSERKGEPTCDMFTVESWSLEKTEEWIRDRILAHHDQESDCTSEEMWERPTKWAVMKKNRKTAIRLHDNKKSAEIMASELGKNHYLEERKGERTRCERYCSVSKFCTQYQEYISGKDSK